MLQKSIYILNEYYFHGFNYAFNHVVNNPFRMNYVFFITTYFEPKLCSMM